MSKILISPHNPVTGPRHLGHLFGSMLDLVELQSKHKCVIILDDLLAHFMYPTHREQIAERTLFVVQDFLNSGIDPDKTDIILTSKVDNFLEMLLKFGTIVDVNFCNHLFENSFTGSLKYYQRKDIGLNKYASVTELIYPQLGIPTITLSANAGYFQGGEEISGYMDIMQEIVTAYNSNFGKTISMPKYVSSKLPFVNGTDGKYMIQANAIMLASSENELKKNINKINSVETLESWFQTIGESFNQIVNDKELLTKQDKTRVYDFLVDFLAPYRNSNWNNGQLMEILDNSSKNFNDLLQEKVIETNNDFGLGMI